MQIYKPMYIASHIARDKETDWPEEWECILWNIEWKRAKEYVPKSAVTDEAIEHSAFTFGLSPFVTHMLFTSIYVVNAIRRNKGFLRRAGSLFYSWALWPFKAYSSMTYALLSPRQFNLKWLIWTKVSIERLFCQKVLPISSDHSPELLFYDLILLWPHYDQL